MLASIVMKRHFHAMKARWSGLTLIEVLVGVAVLGVILAMAVPSMTDLLEKRRVIAAAEEVAGILNYAKAETNATNSILNVRFNGQTTPTMSCAVVATTANSNTCKCSNLPPTPVCSGAQRPLRLFQLPLNHVKFQAHSTKWGGVDNNIRFMRDQFTIAAENFHVEVVGVRKGYTLRVEVNPAGRVKVCAPAEPKTPGALFSKINGYGECSRLPPPPPPAPAP
ncbi:MAG: prepilin-type N-terminal cleavage/methylation domain-containing protein [Rubrivivax sp.]|nr:MAG: prepilin-type N-terminal cleavage/methylation domain-containing protein [Rubrivivax sp.]